MYLVERIIGIITYMTIMLLFIYLIYHTDSKKKLKKYLIFYWVILAIMAFFYIPAKSADLSRLVETMHSYAKLDFNELLDVMSATNIPAECLYFWSIGMLKVDGLLPAITSLIFFGSVFYITYKSACKFDIDNKNVAISLLFFMETGKFLEVISGIRSLMAFSIIAFCIYTEIVENKKIIRNLIFYIFAALMHHAAMILVLIRLVFLLLQKEHNSIKKIFNMIIVILIGLLIYGIASENILSAINKADSYLSHDVYSYIWEYIISWLYIIFSTYSIIKNNKYLVSNNEIYNLKKFVLLINIIVIILNFEYSIFSRFQTFSSILYIPIFSYIIQQKSKDNSKSKKAYTYFFAIVSTAIFIIAGLRGNLSAYKFLLF